MTYKTKYDPISQMFYILNPKLQEPEEAEEAEKPAEDVLALAWGGAFFYSLGFGLGLRGSPAVPFCTFLCGLLSEIEQ